MTKPDKTLNILYVDQTGQLGGGELSLFDWLSEWPQGARVVLFEDGPFRPMLEEIGIPVNILPLKSLKGIRREASWRHILNTLPTLLRLRNSLYRTAKGADVLYANSQKAFLLSALAKRRGQPLVWHLRDILTSEHFSPILRRTAVAVGNRFATIIIVNSHSTAAAFVAAGGRVDKVRVVPDGVSSKLYDDWNAEAIETLRETICPRTEFLVGIFGRLAEWKGQHVLLEAAASLPQLHLCLVGAPLFGEQAYADALSRRAELPDLAGRVHFLGFRKDIPALMRSMDLVVHASTAAEPLGRVIIEAMLARRPVIATRAGGAAEIVEDGLSGLLVAPGSVSELKDAIQLVFGSKNLADTLAAGGRARAEGAFSLQIMVERIKAVLNEVEAGIRK